MTCRHHAIYHIDHVDIIRCLPGCSVRTYNEQWLHRLVTKSLLPSTPLAIYIYTEAYILYICSYMWQNWLVIPYIFSSVFYGVSFGDFTQSFVVVSLRWLHSANTKDSLLDTWLFMRRSSPVTLTSGWRIASWSQRSTPQWRRKTSVIKINN